MTSEEPDCFRDLNLDKLIDPILEREKYFDLAPLYHTPLKSPEDIVFRQEIFKDLLRGDNRKILDSFSREICELKKQQERAEEELRSGSPRSCNYLLFGHILDFGERYCRSIEALRRRLPEMGLKSRGLRLAAGSLEELCESDFYTGLRENQIELRRDFDREQYCMLIKNGTVHVKKYEGEENLSEKITAVFSKFRREGGKDYRQQLEECPRAEHVEAAVLSCLSRIYPALFNRLTEYIRKYSDFIDTGLLKFCREMRFYLSWLDRTGDLMGCGLPFCFPDFGGGRLFCSGFFDIVLAKKIGRRIVRNDFYLEGREKILVVTGPNQGGKTTFARALGQIHYLASLGLSVPGSAANLLLPDQVLTHFEREEDLTKLSGKLEDDLKRLHSLLERTTASSLVIINEIFASTVLEDAEKLGRYMMEKLTEIGARCVIVTFLDALADCGPGTVSMVSTVDPDDPGKRTFKVVRRPPDGLAYAMTLAAGHGLGYEQILRRISP
ncbi:MAG: MutS-related protein [Candidatus Limivicinus sp.]